MDKYTIIKYIMMFLQVSIAILVYRKFSQDNNNKNEK
ncbi:Uncharacterised protein [Streptobacillus moniliformis]|uniref:Uncharacterized protein n=1 Tax=Streptobacillus moniliformis (strain ATCC 14647 / DSM 12112 / NCTC 10651 / 9901) TaxID=519441 RepID=D1AUZ9_STRM9|nr:hypothetical protein Smon_1098 [Streptobacillus moniliformis DSM 12112]SQA13273.1 Uncharacterised protein [Streptobacillus moniliformis]